MFWESCVCPWKWIMNDDVETLGIDDAVSVNFNSYDAALDDFIQNIKNPGIARAFVVFHINDNDDGSIVLGYSMEQNDDMFNMNNI